MINDNECPFYCYGPNPKRCTACLKLSLSSYICLMLDQHDSGFWGNSLRHVAQWTDPLKQLSKEDNSRRHESITVTFWSLQGLANYKGWLNPSAEPLIKNLLDSLKNRRDKISKGYGRLVDSSDDYSFRKTILTNPRHTAQAANIYMFIEKCIGPETLGCINYLLDNQEQWLDVSRSSFAEFYSVSFCINALTRAQQLGVESQLEKKRRKNLETAIQKGYIFLKENLDEDSGLWFYDGQPTMSIGLSASTLKCAVGFNEFYPDTHDLVLEKLIKRADYEGGIPFKEGVKGEIGNTARVMQAILACPSNIFKYNEFLANAFNFLLNNYLSPRANIHSFATSWAEILSLVPRNNFYQLKEECESVEKFISSYRKSLSKDNDISTPLFGFNHEEWENLIKIITSNIYGYTKKSVLKKTHGDSVAINSVIDKKSTRVYDVFLAHNSADKPLVEAIAQDLKSRGLNPWIDKEQVPPGRWFQDVIQKAILEVKSAAIFFGTKGLGNWQAAEIRSFISQCVERDIPVIPVMLPGVEKIPKEFVILKEKELVNFKNEIDEVEALDKLQWGITGEHPKKHRM